MANGDRRQTFGERAVGLAFNHAEGETHDKVHQIKSLYAQVIDLLNDEREAANGPGQARHLSTAITDAETAQMRAVKGLTWKD